VTFSVLTDIVMCVNVSVSLLYKVSIHSLM
jgi:hypothetical protein